MSLTTRRFGFGRVVAIVAAICISAGFFMSDNQAFAANSAVTINNFAFAPASVSVTVGDTVTWTNTQAGVTHTVTSDTGTTLASGNLATSATYAMTFATAGTFAYHCAIHTTMTGTVVVAAAAQAPSPSPSASATTATASATTATTTATTAPATATPVPPTPVPPTPVPATATQGAVQPATSPISLTLSGAEENPPVTTTATGTFRATLGTNSMSFTLAATAGASPMTMAHIHVGAKGTNGGVGIFLFGPVAAGVGTINNSATITTANFVGPLAGKTWQEFLDMLNGGQLYANIHTLANPGGEIRAQIPAAPAAPRTGDALQVTESSGPGSLYIVLGIAVLFTVAAGATVAVRRRN